MTPDRLSAIHALSMTIPRPWTSAQFADLLRSTMTFIVPARYEDEYAGFAMGRVVADEAELLTLAILPKARRKGLGQACLSEFEVKARSEGAIKAFLEVADSNLAARSLYDRAGWQSCGRRRGYYKTADRPEDAVIMQKALT